MKQMDDIVHNYTVAKTTCSCDFSLEKKNLQKLKVTVETTDTDVVPSQSNIVYNKEGCLQYELIPELMHKPVYAYDTRFLKDDGTIISADTYNTMIENDPESAYIACFLGCTYHCG